MKIIKFFFKIGLSAILALGIIVGADALYFGIKARKSPQWEYAQRALDRKSPNFDLRNAVDLSAKDRKDFTNSSWKPMPCINTATSIYTPEHTCGNCDHLVANPARWEFEETKEPVPGDLMIFVKDGDPYHAVIYVRDSILGILCASTTTGEAYLHHIPAFLVSYACGNEIRYYRIQKLTHSHPYVVPEVEKLLTDLGEKFQAETGRANKFVVTSVLRTAEDIRSLQKTNANSIRNSPHQYATTIDISYTSFNGKRSDGELREALAKALQELQKDKRCYVKFEKKQHCYHITVR